MAGTLAPRAWEVGVPGAPDREAAAPPSGAPDFQIIDVGAFLHAELSRPGFNAKIRPGVQLEQVVYSLGQQLYTRAGWGLGLSRKVPTPYPRSCLSLSQHCSPKPAEASRRGRNCFRPGGWGWG